MLTPEQIEGLRDRAETLTEPLTEYLLQEIARRVAEAGQLTSTAAYQTWVAQKLGVSQQEMKRKVAELLGVAEEKAEELFVQSAEVGYRFDLERLPTVNAVPFAENNALQQIVQAAVEQTRGTLQNLTGTLGMTDPYGHLLPLADAYQKCSDFAFLQVFTGATDSNTAVRNAVRNLAEKGIQTIDYESGVHTSVEVAVRRNVMSGLGKMQEQISRQNHDSFGANGWEISAHGACAPDHEPIQGRQYSDEEYERLNGSLIRRIGTLNCGHAAFPIILGVNAPQYSEQELEQLRQENAKGVEYGGKQYTTYEATQHQRKIERAMRKQKKRILVDEATGDTEKLQIDQIRLQRLKQEYNRFSKAAGLRTQPERAQVSGFGVKQAGAAEKEYRQYKKNFTNIGEHGTMKAISGARITNIYGSAAEAHAERYYGLVRSMKTDVARIAQNIGYPESEIQRIKNFIFLDKHDLGGTEPCRFYPSFSMAQSWQRLINGTPEPHDLTLLKHEMLEKNLMDGGMSQSDAHIKASERYNYGKECDDYYAALKERKNWK